MITTSPSFVIGQNYTGPDDSGAVNEIAIIGNGFFIVRDPRTKQSYATQAEHFSLDANGFLVASTGARLQGRISGVSSALGDLQINAAGLPKAAVGGASMVCYSINSRGKISVHLSNAASFLRGQIMLQNFQDQEALVNEGNGLYSNLTAAGPLPAMAAPGSNGLGIIQWGVLELAHSGSSLWTN